MEELKEGKGAVICHLLDVVRPVHLDSSICGYMYEAHTRLDSLI